MPPANMSGSFRPARRPTVWQRLFGRWLKQRTPGDASLGSAKGNLTEHDGLVRWAIYEYAF
jgi:hypothetical protein